MLKNREWNWYDFIEKESRKVIDLCRNGQSNSDWGGYALSEYFTSDSIGYSGATEQQISMAEERLKIVLPSSYRDFLNVSNGWPELPQALNLRSVDLIDWFHIENQEWIDIWLDSFPSDRGAHIPVEDGQYLKYDENDRKCWSQPLRHEYLQTCLQLSDEIEGEVVLLNPKTIHNGEWEAWIFSNRGPGSKRYRSFSEMIELLGLSGFWFE
jgi:hypothetical protein